MLPGYFSFKTEHVKKLTITDNEGKVIEVTDLDEAIQEVTQYRDLHNTISDKTKFGFIQEAANKKKSYWQDIHDKLIQLKNNQQ